METSAGVQCIVLCDTTTDVYVLVTRVSSGPLYCCSWSYSFSHLSWSCAVLCSSLATAV